jgi:hypothetical protein
MPVALAVSVVVCNKSLEKVMYFRPPVALPTKTAGSSLTLQLPRFMTTGVLANSIFLVPSVNKRLPLEFAIKI